MHLARTIARRSLWGRPGRTLFSALGIALGIATVVGIFALDHNTVRSRSFEGDATWQADIEISPSVAAVDPGAELEALEGLSNVTAAFQNQASVARPERPDLRAQVVALVAIEAEDAPRLGAYRLNRGRDIDPGSLEREIVVGGELAMALELELGDVLDLAKPTRAPKRTCVDGEWELQREADSVAPAAAPLSFTVVGMLERENLGRRAGGKVALVDYDDGLELFEGANVQTRYWARRDAAVDLEETEKQLSSAYSYELKKSVIVGQAADERAFRNGVRFAGLLALVLGLFVIFYTLSRSLVERVREVATLHALGSTRAQVARVFLLEALAIAGAGGALGLAGGLGFAAFALRHGVTTLGRGRAIETFEVPWAVVLPLAVAGVLLALVGSIYPLWRARRVSAAAALRGEDAGLGGLQKGFQIFAAVLLVGVLPGLYFALVPVLGELDDELVGVLFVGLGILALFIGLPLLLPSLLGALAARLASPFERRWPLAGSLSARALRQDAARVSGAVAGLALVVAGFVALRSMTRTLQAEIEVWSDQAFLDKVYVQGLPNVPFEELAADLARYPGVLGVEPGDLRHYVPFLVVGVEADQLARYGPIAADPAIAERLEREQGIVLSRRLALHIDREVGSEIHVQTGDGDVASLPVLAIADDYGYAPHPDERLYGVVAAATLREHYCIDGATAENVAVRLERGSDPGVVESAVRDFLAHASAGSFRAGPWDSAPPSAPEELEYAATLARNLAFESGRELRELHTADIDRDFFLFDAILLLSALLAALGMLNGQLLAALERTKELGILRALGTTQGQVAGMVLLEALVTGLLGALVGLALGAALGPVIVRSLAAISGLPLAFEGPGWALAQGAAAALALALAASLYPIWRMNRASAVSAVRAPG